jgi:AcrR family transcriptional regulator
MAAESVTGPSPAAAPKRRMRAPARRAAILRSAARCFAAAGFDGTSMDDVALAAGVSKPVVYDHFPSKEALYLALLTDLSDRLFAGSRAAIAPGQPNAQGIAAAVAVLVRFVAGAPDEAGLLFQQPHGEGPLASAARIIQQRATAGIAEMLAPRAPGAAPWRYLLAAEFMKSGLHAASLWWRDHPEIEAERLTEDLTTLVRSGLAGAFGWRED